MGVDPAKLGCVMLDVVARPTCPTSSPTSGATRRRTRIGSGCPVVSPRGYVTLLYGLLSHATEIRAYR